jgi:hypothetical protein
VLPIWADARLAAASPGSAAAVTGILRACMEGVPSAAAAAATARGAAGARAAPAPDPAVVAPMMEMGFSEARVLEALRRVRALHGPWVPDLATHLGGPGITFSTFCCKGAVI